METKEEKGSVPEFIHRSTNVTPQSNDFDEKLVSVESFSLAVFDVKVHLHEHVGSEVENWWQSDKRQPHIREQSCSITNISIVSSNVSSSEGFFGSTGKSHHRPVDKVIHKLGASHVGSPVSSHVHNFLFGNNKKKVEQPKWNEPNVNVGKEVVVKDPIHGAAKNEGSNEVKNRFHVELS
jgi:hypothetical protein